MIPIINNTMRVKQVNVELVKTALKALAFGTKLAIANATGLSVATCGNILNELLERGEVIEADLEQPNGGRPARRFMYNANYSYIACIYVSNEGGIYKTIHVVTNLAGEILEEISMEVEVINYEVIDSLILKLICSYENIKAIGIGVPGIIHKGEIGSCDIKELIDIPLATRLKAKYGLQITVENDMNLISYGFYKRQNYDEDKTIAVVIFPKDNCSGAGIIVEGHIIRGNTNFAGEVSYLPFDHLREEQIMKITHREVYFPLIVKTIASIIAVINPETIVVTGGLIRSDMIIDISNSCETFIPHAHMPQIIIQENMQSDYIYGLVSMTLESLTCDIQLIEKKV
ncbi:ROK family protein [Pelosinus propionicus]|uniref:Sugar kinase of the NBD/HSP70 family, may contain an N-terminal HTH domain n=1 Tax=Pelosinus propionicus DSM 13327 TaxID=1123291 RepID=A0A1I4Q536_9FIRM|nr:ROK family protein [Pelosinus propionicus]SFM35172.1 Sugar kinase of the NBD/HSP70 family, may contain an N-terminal HTH domain [Pelosinus propionicus DSM 13327]